MTVRPCPYCNALPVRVGGASIYPHRSDLHAKTFYLCAPCKAYVGTHPGTHEPLGTVANAPTRSARATAHAHFDPLWKQNAITLWKQNAMTRSQAYARVAQLMGITAAECHISLFNVDQCKDLIEAVKHIKRDIHAA